ncbi:MAG TPA: BrnT family toxin [Spirochaetota bacterium]|nr:BrnT family toxin [Spirochaetota bacterium]HPJ36321.1 BrnT family toxin [Spirochaetota bacterium]
MIFEWDPNKNIINKKKHGISFEEAILIFTDRDALSIYDDEHSSREDRWITIGFIPAGKILVVVHTDRLYIEKKEVIRIISARKATEKESRDYYLNKG